MANIIKSYIYKNNELVLIHIDVDCLQKMETEVTMRIEEGNK